MNLLRLPNETIWLILKEASPATRVQALHALGWFNAFWPAVFAMTLDDMIELMQAICSTNTMTKQLARFYMSIIRNWSFKHRGWSFRCKEIPHVSSVVRHDMHPLLLKMWLLYNDVSPNLWKRAAATGGSLQNFQIVQKSYPEPVTDDVEYAFRVGNEEISRYLLHPKPELTVDLIAIAVENFALPYLQELHESYAELFPNAQVINMIAKSCKLDVLKWIHQLYDCQKLSGRVGCICLESSMCSRAVVQWLHENGHLMNNRTIYHLYTPIPNDQSARDYLAENGYQFLPVVFNDIGGRDHPPTPAAQPQPRPRLRDILMAVPFDAAAAGRLSRGITFRPFHLIDDSVILSLTAMQWMNAHNSIDASALLLEAAPELHRRDPAILKWLLDERNDPINDEVFAKIAYSGNVEAYKMVQSKHATFRVSNEVLLKAAKGAPLDMLSLLFQLHPHLKQQSSLRYVYEHVRTPSVRTFLESIIDGQEAPVTNILRAKGEELLAAFFEDLALV